jgi:hypothetical protein
MRYFPVALLLLGLCGSSPAAPHPGSPPPVVGKFLALFDRLRAEESRPAAARRHVEFQFSQDEITQYLRYSLQATPRPGLVSVQVKIFPRNYISTFTVLDFDAVERWKPGTIPTLLRPVLRGRKSIWLDCRFQTQNGKATFSVEKAYFQDIRLPAFFVERVIHAVAARQPEHYDTSKPVPLPFGLRRLGTTGNVIAGGN